MTVPATSTPATTEGMAFRRGMSKKAAARAPVQAPVPDDEEGHGDQVADDGGQPRRPHRQSRRHPKGDASPQLHHRDHRHQHGQDELAELRLGQPLKQIQNGILLT